MQATLTYDGICPGIMDIEPYPCTMGEFIGRNTTSFYALTAHIFLTAGWIAVASLLLVGFFLVRYFRNRTVP